MMDKPLATRRFLQSKTFWFVGAQLLLVVLISEIFLHQWKQRQMQEQWLQVLAEANQARALLESELNAAAALATGIGIYVSARGGDIDSNELERMLEVVFDRGSYFRNIGLAPNNRLDYLFPIEGNEAALGLNYEALPDQWPVLQDIISSREGRLAGPLTLVQGGEALLYREPIFIQDEYWGILSTVMNADGLLGTLDSLRDVPGARIGLRGKDAMGASGEMILGDELAFDSPSSIFLDVFVPGGSWQLAAKPDASDIPFPLSTRPIVWGTVFLLIFAITGSLRALLQRRTIKQMERLVEDRTQSLAETNGLLTSVLNAAQDFSIIATDKQGIITLFNTGAENMLGYSAVEMVGRETLEVVHLPEEMLERAREVNLISGQSMAPLKAILYRATQGDQDICEWTYVRKDGTRLPVILAICPIYGQMGELAGYLGISTDITERKRVDRLKNEFVATVSHELRTPLTSIIGSLGLLQHQSASSLTEAHQSLLQVAVRNAHRLSALINDLLDISKIEAGMMELSMKVLPLAPLVSEALELQRGYADRYNVTLRQDASDDNPNVVVDAFRLQQVLANLLSNAIKFSFSGSDVRVFITVNNGWARVSIKDEGAGIPVDFQPRLFDKFTQAESSDSRSQGGTGLGLTICRELIEQMHGRIGFSSKVGEGSLFWIELPLATAPFQSGRTEEESLL